MEDQAQPASTQAESLPPAVTVPAQPNPTPVASPLSLSRPKRAAASATDAKIQASLKAEDTEISEAVVLPAKKSRGKQSAVMQSNPGPFKLERYFGLHEFNAKILLSNSDVESLSLKALLQLCTEAKDEATLALWEEVARAHDLNPAKPPMPCSLFSLPVPAGAALARVHGITGPPGAARRGGSDVRGQRDAGARPRVRPRGGHLDRDVHTGCALGHGDRHVACLPEPL